MTLNARNTYKAGKKALAATLLTVVLASCSETINHKGRTPLAEADGFFIYKEELQAVLPPNLSGEDSMRFAKEYIDNRIKEILLYNKAQKNINDEGKIDRLVEKYRQSLVTNEYQSQLLQEKFNDTVSQAAIANFYNSNPKLFIADRTFMKGMYLKMSNKNSDLPNVRQWMKLKRPDDRDKIERFTIKGAAEYENYTDTWIQADMLLQKIPMSDKERKNGIRQGEDIEVKDSTYIYFLHVDSVITAGQTVPLSLAENDVRDILVNMNKADFIRQLKKELFDEAQNKGRIKYYK